MCSRHRWLANLTMHPHAKRCTYLRATVRYMRGARLRSRECLTTPAQSLIPTSLSTSISIRAFFIFLTLLLQPIAILRMQRALPGSVHAPSCTPFEKERERILSLPRLSLLLEPATRTQGYRRRNKRREKEKGSDEGDGRKREKGGGRGGEREKVSGAIIWYPWLVSGSASRRQGRLCWIYL